MALFRRIFHRKPPDGLLEISDRIFVFDYCFSTDVFEDDEYKAYVGNIISQLRGHVPDGSFMVFNFRQGERQSQVADILSKYDITVMDYPRHYEGCPLLTIEIVHHFLKSSKSWLSLSQQNILLMHCERGGWPVLAFMLAGLLIYLRQYSGEQKTLEMIYKQAPRELLQLLSPLNPLASQIRYLQYISRRNFVSEWPPQDRVLTLDCVIIRKIPNFGGKGGFRPLFRIYGKEPSFAADRMPTVLFSTPKKHKNIRLYKQADSELIKIDIRCRIQGDVLLECISLDEDLEHEEMMFRVVFNTAFIRSNLLMLNRDEIDILWDARDWFPKEFRAEVLLSEIDAVATITTVDSTIADEKKGLPAEAFSKVQEIFNNMDWLGANADAALKVLHQISSLNTSGEEQDTSSSKKVKSDAILQDLTPDRMTGKFHADERDNCRQQKPLPLQLDPSLPTFFLPISMEKIPLTPHTPKATFITGMEAAIISPHETLEQIGQPPPSLPPLTTISSQHPTHGLGSPSEDKRTVPLASLPPNKFLPVPEIDNMGHLHPQMSENLLNKPLSTPSPPPPLPSLLSECPSPPSTNNILPTAGIPLPPPPPPLHLGLSSPKVTPLTPLAPPPPPRPPHPPSLCPGFASPKVTPSKLPPMPPPRPPPPHTPSVCPGLTSPKVRPPTIPPPPPPHPPLKTSAGVTGSQPNWMGRKGNNNDIVPNPHNPEVILPLNSVGMKGRGLKRTTTPKTSQFAHSSSKKILKPLHWVKVTRAVKGSLWAESQRPSEDCKSLEIDMSELESLFSATLPNANEKSRRCPAIGLKTDKIHLIDLTRARNCEIMLTKVKMPVPCLLNSVLELDDSLLDAELVGNLIKLCPTKEEMELLQGYNGDRQKLGKCEQFFLEMMDIPRIESKLRVFFFKSQFDRQVSDLRNNLNIVNSVAAEITNSVKLKRIMQTILSLGNALNQGTARGSAIGFKLDSLLKLSDIRARSNKMTLMHYLCKVLADKIPEVLDFDQDIASLEAAAKIQLKFLAEEMQAVSKGLEKVEQELTSSENDGPVSHTFHKTLKEFLVHAEAEVRMLTSLYSSMGRSADALVLYFGEDPARCPFEQVISTLHNFIKMFGRAHEENCKQLELEKRKKAQREAENFKK